MPPQVHEAGQLIAEGKLRRVSPFFVPRILTNMVGGVRVQQCLGSIQN